MGRTDSFLAALAQLCLSHGIVIQGCAGDDWHGEWMELHRIKDGKKLRTLDNDFLKEFVRHDDDDDGGW